MRHTAITVIIYLTHGFLPVIPKIIPLTAEISLGVKYNFNISASTEYIISVSNLTEDLALHPPRVNIECYNCDKKYPAIITFRQDRGVTSFLLPIIMPISEQREVIYNTTEHTLCPYTATNSWDTNAVTNNFAYTENDTSSLTVSLSTSNRNTVIISLEIALVENFIMSVDENYTFSLTVSAPKFYMYKFPSDMESVVLKVSSDSKNCMIMSIQNISCPVDDTAHIHHSARYQTVTNLGAMTVMKNNYPDGFYSVFSLCPDDSYCTNPMANKSKRSKTVVVSVFKSISNLLLLYAIIGTLVAISIVYIVLILVTFLCFMRKDIKIPDLEEIDILTSSAEPSKSSCVPQPINSKSDNTILSPTTDDSSSMTDSSLDETDLDVLNDVEFDKNIVRTKPVLCLSDLAKKNPTVLNKKSELYFWNLITVAIFYGLPASQLVVTYQYNLNQSGNEDICYYNFLCSHPLGNINDFNHFFSNIGYITLGVLFLIITQRKKKIHEILLSQNKNLDRQYGVPQHFGLFYAMGASLIIEGILSACYHICPNIDNFQFDASFMYVIGTLCMIKIYQSRHPDVNATAYSTFFLIAFVMFLELCGILTNTLAYWIVLNICHFGTIFYISLQIYNVGTLSFGIKDITRYIKECRFRLRSWRPLYRTRFGLIVAINICNWALAISALMFGVKDVALYLLLIFILNLMLYITFYIIMKLKSGEKILLQPFIYIILSVACWSVALYYFFNKTISWKKTPAESRLLNKPCELFGFYDNHDIWHFISAGGLFFAFMVLLTLDDDLIFVHRCRISVF